MSAVSLRAVDEAPTCWLGSDTSFTMPISTLLSVPTADSHSSLRSPPRGSSFLTRTGRDLRVDRTIASTPNRDLVAYVEQPNNGLHDDGRKLPRLNPHVGRGQILEIPSYDVRSYGNGDRLPDEAEDLFAKELEYSREPLPEDRTDRDCWRFACVCAVTPEGHVLGGVHLDMGPINFGPLAKEKLAFVEALFVRPEYRRRGVATRTMREAISVARDAGCLHMRCNVEWDNPAGIALYRKCGFALTDITEEGGSEYFVVRPLQVAEERPAPPRT